MKTGEDEIEQSSGLIACAVSQVHVPIQRGNIQSFDPSWNDAPHMVRCKNKSQLNAHLQSWVGLRLFGGTFFVLNGVPDLEVGVAPCVVLRSMFNSESARCSLGTTVAVVVKRASASSSAGRCEKNRNWIFCSRISAVVLRVAGDLGPALTEKPSWYWSSSKRTRLSSSSPFFRGVDGGSGTEAGAALERWPAPLPALPCGWTKRGGCCMTAKPCRRFPDNKDQKLNAVHGCSKNKVG